jgi:drug/metabolite transporter (DMT)-like permease
MSVFLIFCSGVICLAGILLIKNRALQGPAWKIAVNWVLYFLWFGITMMGCSFIFINSGVGHVKATSTAIFLFLGLSVILAVALLRLLGFLGKRSGKPVATDE